VIHQTTIGGLLLLSRPRVHFADMSSAQLLTVGDILTISSTQMVHHEHCELAAGDFTNQPNNALSITHIQASVNTDS